MRLSCQLKRLSKDKVLFLFFFKNHSNNNSNQSNFVLCRETLVIVNKVYLFNLYTVSTLQRFPGAAEVEVTMQQQFGTHVKIIHAHLLHLDNE